MVLPMTVSGNIKPALAETIALAGRLIREGLLVAFPTETVYGLGADASNDRAVAAIFAAKARPQFNPLIVHVQDLNAAIGLAELDPLSIYLARHFWPGPFTLIAPRRTDSKLSLLVSAGLDTVALRVPAHPVAQALLRAAARPIAAPSANRSGRISPTTAQHVAEELGDKVSLILDGGACPLGIESTVAQVRDGKVFVLRPGSITREAIAAIAGPVRLADGGGPLVSPGQMQSHYAPRLPLRLNAEQAGPREAALAFADKIPQGAAKVINLSASGDLTEAAANLFAMLRQLDSGEFSAIAIAPIPGHGLGEAINDRLCRAANLPRHGAAKSGR